MIQGKQSGKRAQRPPLARKVSDVKTQLEEMMPGARINSAKEMISRSNKKGTNQLITF